MKLKIRRILNLLLYLSFCVMIGTGLMMAYRLVPGSRGGRGLEVLGWNRHQWGDFHTWVAFLFVALILIHLALNWAWLVKCAAKGLPWRLAAGLLVGAPSLACSCCYRSQNAKAGEGGKADLLPRFYPEVS
jgi:hypothetical protein